MLRVVLVVLVTADVRERHAVDLFLQVDNDVVGEWRWVGPAHVEVGARVSVHEVLERAFRALLVVGPEVGTRQGDGVSQARVLDGGLHGTSLRAHCERHCLATVAAHEGELVIQGPVFGIEAVDDDGVA